MKPVSYILFFVFVLTISMGISFVGYRYLALANDYRAANIEHLNAVFTAIDLIRREPVPSQTEIAQLLQLIEHANDQAVWCIENLNAFDMAMFQFLEAESTLDVCREAISTGNASIEFLNALSQVSQSTNRSVTASFVLYSQVIEEIEKLRDLSVSFQPYVTNIQDQLEVLVRTGTAGLSVFLILLSARVAGQLIQAQERIRKQSVTDELTGLTNRRGLDLVLSARDPESEVLLARVDLDRFKQVNDILGHEAGDFVLQHVAQLMRDLAWPSDTLARVGGDEFVILFAAGMGLEDGCRCVERLLKAISRPVRFGEKQCDFGASIGIASSSLEGLSKNELLNAADRALYEVKRSGRGAISVYSEDMHSAAVRERYLADGLREAIANNEIIPFFQTQHFCRGGNVFGIEVLARWQHPKLGLLTPDVFLPIASQLGLESELDSAIFCQTVELLDDFDAAGLTLPRVAFNVSPGRLVDPEFLNDIQKIAPAYRGNVAFEILESVSYEDTGEHLSFTIDTLREQGFQIDVDDFGSGHASINSVLNIAPNALKIDKNIVRPIETSAAAHRLTASIVELANALNMIVIAEGVDSAEKADLLADMGCYALQGFYFSKPMSAADLKAFLSRWETIETSELSA